MEKVVKIGEKEYKLKSSAFTIFSYKQETGRDLIKDLNLINKKQIEISKSKDESLWIDEFGGILEDLLKLAYVMNKEADSNVTNYEDWLKGIDCLLDDNKWIIDVLTVGMAPFRRGIQAPADAIK